MLTAPFGEIPPEGLRDLADINDAAALNTEHPAIARGRMCLDR